MIDSAKTCKSQISLENEEDDYYEYDYEENLDSSESTSVGANIDTAVKEPSESVPSETVPNQLPAQNFDNIENDETEALQESITFIEIVIDDLKDNIKEIRNKKISVEKALVETIESLKDVEFELRYHDDAIKVRF